MSEGAVLRGVERALVFNRLRAAIGLRFEMPLLLEGVSLPAGARTLEIGAGLGWGTLGLVRRLRPRLAVVTDYDERVLPTTRAYLSRESGARVVLARADAKRLPFDDATFDLVLVSYALHHVLGYRAALGEIARVLRPEGALLAADPVWPSFLPRVRSSAAPDGLPSERELRALIAGAGLSLERWRRFGPFAYLRARREGA